MKEEKLTPGNLSDRKTVYATESLNSVRSGLKKVGDPITRHPNQADALVASGKATEAMPNTKTEKAKV